MNKKILIILVAFLAIIASIFLFLNISKRKASSTAKQTQKTTQSNAADKLKNGSFPANLQKQLDSSKPDPAGAPGSLILLTNNEMVIAYNGAENTFIVTANGKSNEEAAKTDYQAYLKGLGVDDLSKLNIIFRVRGQW